MFPLKWMSNEPLGYQVGPVTRLASKSKSVVPKMQKKCPCCTFLLTQRSICRTFLLGGELVTLGVCLIQLLRM